MCKSLTNYFPRNNDFLVTYFGKTQTGMALSLKLQPGTKPPDAAWNLQGGSQ